MLHIKMKQLIVNLEKLDFYIRGDNLDIIKSILGSNIFWNVVTIMTSYFIVIITLHVERKFNKSNTTLQLFK